MGCSSCGKRRSAAPIYGSNSKPSGSAPSSGKSTPPIQPTKVRFPDGEIREYQTRLEAHAARILAGGGDIVE